MAGPAVTPHESVRGSQLLQTLGSVSEQQRVPSGYAVSPLAQGKKGTLSWVVHDELVQQTIACANPAPQVNVATTTLSGSMPRRPVPSSPNEIFAELPQAI